MIREEAVQFLGECVMPSQKFGTVGPLALRLGFKIAGDNLIDLSVAIRRVACRAHEALLSFERAQLRNDDIRRQEPVIVKC